MRAANNRKAFRRTPVSPDTMQQPRMITIPAAIRGLILNENPAFMEPGGATVLDNFFPSQRGLRVRGGCQQWGDTGSGQPIISSFNYVVGWTMRMFFGTESALWDGTLSGAATAIKTAQNSGNYCASQMSNQGGDWMIVVNDAGDYPLRFNGTTWATLDPTIGAVNWANSTAYAVDAVAKDTLDNTYWKCLVAHTSPATGSMGDDRTAHPTYWGPNTATDGVSHITGPYTTPVQHGHGLSYVWKYRNRFYFIEGGTMNLWYLDLNSVGGQIELIPLSGAATKGGALLFGATWSIDAGDGTDDKNIVVTTLGEVLVFTGNDPADANNWRQEGRYTISPPLGMNAHIQVGGDILIATVDGIVPVSACIDKERVALELAAVTRTIERDWELQVLDKRNWPWMMYKWDERSMMFVTLPGGEEGERVTYVANVSTGAWCRFTGWDATTFTGLQGNCFFGTQDGRIMQAWRGGMDDGKTYLCRYVGGWEHFGNRSAMVTWRQARCAFASEAGEPFQPQLTATVDYQVKCPTPPNAGPDPGLRDAWDQALWGPDGSGDVVPPLPPADVEAWGQWDQSPAIFPPPIRNTYWVSIGETGYAHAPIVQVTVAQQVTPQVGLISIDAVVEILGTAV